MIEVTCPNCNKTITVPDKAVGRAGICPACHARVVVPGAQPGSGAAPAAAQSAPAKAAPGGAKPGPKLELMDDDAALAKPAPGAAKPAPKLELMDDDEAGAAAPAGKRPEPQAPAPAPVTKRPASAPAPAKATSGNAAPEPDLALAPEAEEPAPIAPPVGRNPCPFCGQMIAVTAKKCRFCGELLEAATASHAAARGDTGRHGAVKGNTGRNRAVMDEDDDEEERPRKSPVTVVIIAAAAVVLALAIGAYMYQQSVERERVLRALEAERQAREAERRHKQVEEQRQSMAKAEAERRARAAKEAEERKAREKLANLRRRANNGDIDAQRILALEHGDVTAQLHLGNRYANGLGVDVDRREAEKWYQMAAAQGSLAARNALKELAQKAEREGKEDLRNRSEKGDIDAIRELAKAGEADAQRKLGVCYFQGNHGVVKDRREAAKWFAKAAGQKDPWSQFFLGLCYENGDGVEEDEREAVSWYTKAAVQGLAPAQDKLGDCYWLGTGIEKDEREAAKWYKKAAEQGYADAQWRFAFCCYVGSGVDENPQEAVKWCKKAAEQGHERAKAKLDEFVRNAETAGKRQREATTEQRLAATNLTVTLPGGVDMEMVYVKAGTFTMGSPATEIGRDDDEEQHEVAIERSYLLSKSEVTQGQWKAIMDNNPSKFQKGDNYPVENVSWNDAKAYCARLNELFKDQLPSGYAFDLPTEAQWEYAARGGHMGNGSTMYSGGNDLDAVAWHSGNSGKGKRAGTQPTGKKKPNELGLCDMSGNVYEWCQDLHGKDKHRGFRGGSWEDGAWYCRVADQVSGTPSYRSSAVGFRVALVYAAVAEEDIW